MNDQLQAGFVFDSVKELLSIHYPKDMISGLMKQLSIYDIELDTLSTRYDNSAFEPVLCVAYNILSRGLPTRTSHWVEKMILPSGNPVKKPIYNNYTVLYI